MIDVLRPYLKDTAIDGFTSHSSNMPSDATPLRHKDLAANAILTLLGEPEMVNPHSRASLPAGSRRGGRGSPGPGAESAEPYPEWLVWDKKIGELEARLGVQNGSVLGQILTPAGKPAAGVRVVALMAPDPAATAAAIQSVTNTGPDGRYLLEGLSPGRFNVAARTPSRPYDSLGARTFYPGVRSQSDAAVVTIGSGPTVPRIDFTLLPFIKVSGQIYTDGPVSRPADFDVASVGVIATPVANQFARTSTAQVQSDGSFILDGIDNETNYRIGLTISNGYLADARYGSDHPLKAPLALNEEGTLLHLMIRFDVARVEAPVASDGRPFAGATAVLVPLDRTRRDLYRSAISNAQGTAVFTNVAPGDYTVFAWENPRDVDWMNPAFLKQFETSGRAERISKSTVSIDAIPIKP
jgi:hypothetical protein